MRSEVGENMHISLLVPLVMILPVGYFTLEKVKGDMMHSCTNKKRPTLHGNWGK
jgi:hypothetical protein